MHTKFLAIDFETANTEANSACAVGLVRVENKKIVHKEVHLIRPPSRKFMFSYIHGIHWTDVENAPTWSELWPVIEPQFKDIEFLAAHNSGFDRRVLNGVCEHYGIKAPNIPFSCSMQLARREWNIRPTKLSDVCRHLDIELNHHEALSDAMACARIFISANG